ncbi:hypothetical protein [Candidatus Phytoplasma sp. AldY-WA1]|uniref:hypothetical protein n=1 Tax=Candidatus Phytoplasma sp. AldY-WA1 TaxID=2852100 RepID=UPI00254DD7BC|nr:hypothetical protein [Candidatus Phytoplasma sp. AldY-WA1]
MKFNYKIERLSFINKGKFSFNNYNFDVFLQVIYVLNGYKEHEWEFIEKHKEFHFHKIEPSKIKEKCNELYHKTKNLEIYQILITNTGRLLFEKIKNKIYIVGYDYFHILDNEKKPKQSLYNNLRYEIYIFLKKYISCEEALKFINTLEKFFSKESFFKKIKIILRRIQKKINTDTNKNNLEKINDSLKIMIDDAFKKIDKIN